MRLEKVTLKGNLNDALNWINKKGISSMFNQFILNDGTVDVILKFDSFPQYCHYAEKIGLEKLNEQQYFN